MTQAEADQEVGPWYSKLMEKMPEMILYPEIASELSEMLRVDQEMREKNINDSEFWDDEVDRNNTERMKAIVAKIGWPTKSKVGLEGAHQAWLIVQHADKNVDFQIQCLDLMKQESSDEVEKRSVAYLEDRVRVNQGRSQLYGTQFYYYNGKYGPRPIDDMEHLEERRKEMGLESMEEYERILHEKYNPPKEE